MPPQDNPDRPEGDKPEGLSNYMNHMRTVLKRAPRLDTDGDSNELKKPRLSQRVSGQKEQEETPMDYEDYIPDPLKDISSSAQDLHRKATATPESRELSPLLLSPQSPQEDSTALSQFMSSDRARVGSMVGGTDEGAWGYLIPLFRKDLIKPQEGPLVLKTPYRGAKRDGSTERNADNKQGQSSDQVSGGYLIGRHPACDLVIDKPTVSNRHFLLFPGHAGDTSIKVALLQDLSSSGTFVNDVLVGRNNVCELEDGNRVSTLDVRFVFYYSRPQGGSVINHQVADEPMVYPRDTAVSDENSWMETLLSIGYSSSEVDALVSGKEHDSPWIFFTSSYRHHSNIHPGQHVAGCAHQCCSPYKAGLENRRIVRTARRSEAREIEFRGGRILGFNPTRGGRVRPLQPARYLDGDADEFDQAGAELSETDQLTVLDDDLSDEQNHGNSGAFASSPRKSDRTHKHHPLTIIGGRARVTGNRPKNGCLTCRRREKKCDESRPVCLNCTRDGFMCEGYPAKGTSKSGREKTTNRKRFNSEVSSSANSRVFNQLEPTGGSDALTILEATTPVCNKNVVERIEELCGLAGIKPSTRSKKDWNGSSDFSEKNTVADCYLFGDRITSVLYNIRSAIGLLQENGLCCDSFTILKICPLGSSTPDQKPTIEVIPINFRLIQNLILQSLDQGKEALGAALAILELLFPGLDESIILSATNSVMVSSYCALATQLVAVGLLSYVQAHVGPLLPFFLDTPVQNVSLLGCPEETMPLHLQAKLVDLSCLGNMTRGPVLAFHASSDRLDPFSSRPRKQQMTISYDIQGQAEDILDTWGPGSLVFLENTTKPPVAIKIGDGFIYFDSSSDKLHWARELDESTPPRPIDLSRSLTIGALVSPNADCLSSEAECRVASAGALEYLGASRSSWKRSQRQLGLQGGQYIVGQATETWNKQTGIPVKDVALSSLQLDLIQYLDDYWGLQVSYCTGVARRVPLRKLVADLVPHFSKESDLQTNLQEILRNDTASLASFQNWLEGLGGDLKSQILTVIQRILLSLRHTGLDATEKYFCIAWPWNGDASRCFKIPIEGWSSWARMLADSHDCATFAYITMECLETSDIKCSHSAPQTPYQNNIHLLETAVTCPNQISKPWSLKDGEVYFFSKLDSIFWVKVQREQAAQAASLIELAALMSIPHDMKRRLYVSERKKERARLRERPTPLVKGEMVAVFSMRQRPIAQVRMPAQVTGS